MITETTINLKNKSKEELILMLNESLGVIEKLQKENENLKEYIAIAPNLDEMTAIKYRNIRQDAYIQGRAEEQQKAKQIIYENYISKEKVKKMIKEKEWALENYNCDESDYKQSQAIGAWDILQKLLKESEEK